MSCVVSQLPVTDGELGVDIRTPAQVMKEAQVVVGIDLVFLKLRGDFFQIAEAFPASERRRVVLLSEVLRSDVEKTFRVLIGFVLQRGEAAV